MKKILLLIIISIQIPGLLYAQDDTKIFRHGQLDNGLTYYVRHTTMQPGKADFYLVQNVGALMEEDNQNGWPISWNTWPSTGPRVSRRVFLIS